MKSPCTCYYALSNTVMLRNTDRTFTNYVCTKIGNCNLQILKLTNNFEIFFCLLGCNFFLFLFIFGKLIISHPLPPLHIHRHMNSDIHRLEEEEKRPPRPPRNMHTRICVHTSTLWASHLVCTNSGIITRILFVLTLMTHNFSLVEKFIYRIEIQKNIK